MTVLELIQQLLKITDMHKYVFVCKRDDTKIYPDLKNISCIVEAIEERNIVYIMYDD